MIKLLHCADIHLGSPLAGLPADMREERRRELRATFGRMADYASEGGFAGILICGDAFDSDRPLKKDKEYFYNIVKLHPSLDFFYLRGNHDVGQSYTESLPNLKTFGTEWSYYTYGDVVVAGIELCESNRLSEAKANYLSATKAERDYSKISYREEASSFFTVSFNASTRKRRDPFANFSSTMSPDFKA